jgi:nucleoside-diphosphate-sugar epimerase
MGPGEGDRSDHIVSLKRPNSVGPRIPLQSEPRWLEKSIDQVQAGDVDDCDVLLHLASHTPNPPYDNLLNCMRWNVIETLRLFEEAKRAGVSRYVVAGSCFEYGKSGERYEFIPANAPLEPTLTYPASKAAASIALQQWSREHNLSLSLHRIFNVYGEGEDPARLWPSLRCLALSGRSLEMTPGMQVRDFIAVEAVADRLLDACLRLSDLQSPFREVSNLGSGQPTTVRSFAEYWWHHWGASSSLEFGVLPYRAGEVMRFVPDLTPVSF